MRHSLWLRKDSEKAQKEALDDLPVKGWGQRNQKREGRAGEEAAERWACMCTGESEGAEDVDATIPSESPGRHQSKAGQQGPGSQNQKL